MSSILCGSFELARALSPREVGAIGFTLAALAIEARFGLQLGCAVVQPIVFEALGRGRAFDGASLPFLITDNPAWDSSEAVIDKYAPEYPDEEPDGPLAVRLGRVERFLAQATALPEVARAVLIVGAGSGVIYDDETIRAGQLVERLLPRYADVLEVPRVRLFVTKG